MQLPPLLTPPMLYEQRPLSANNCGGRLAVAVSVCELLALLVTVKLAFITLPGPRQPPGSVIVADSLLTETLKLHAIVLLLASCAEQLTGVVPIGKELPGAGVQLTAP